MVTNLLMLIAGFAILIVGANYLVDGASSLAKKFNISNLIIGLTVVAMGTSAPEMTVSIYSAYKGESDIALGNVIGSNIINVLAILGITATIYPLSVQSSTVWKEIPFSLLAAVLVAVFANDVLLDSQAQSNLSRTEGIALLGFMAIFLYYTFDVARKSPPDDLHNPVKEHSLLLTLVMVVGGLAMLILGGKWLVDGAVAIAEGMGMSKSLIGLTIVALGTSMPELATSLVAALKKQADIAVGNVVGSNIFNVFFILGTTAVIQPLSIGGITQIDFLVCIASSLLLFLFAYNNKISRIEGSLLLAGLVFYMTHLIVTAA
jgi:cation:H+ antiporter